MKLCKDCAYYVPHNQCGKQPELISGGINPGWRGAANLQREDSFLIALFMNTCGTRARWFKEKTK